MEEAPLLAAFSLLGGFSPSSPLGSSSSLLGGELFLVYA